MASLKVFVSSTCYDLGVIRSNLRNFISGLGYTPIMSDYSDVLYDPRHHTHSNCIQEVNNCDILILIIGKRFGGTAIPKALDQISIETVKSLSTRNEIFKENAKLSITQLEVVKAIELGIPIFTFVDSRVYSDHLVYESNKDIHSTIKFPSIEKEGTAIYIFEFINFITHLTDNNSIQEFSKTEDIENHLRKQWSGLLQRLLAEQKTFINEERKLESIYSQIADIKTTILATIPNDDLKETAKASIKFRSFIETLFQLSVDSIENILLLPVSWEELLDKMNIKECTMLPLRHERFGRNVGLAFIKTDNTFYLAERFSLTILNKLKEDWQDFCLLDEAKKTAVLHAIKDNYDSRRMPSRFRYMNLEVDDYLKEFYNDV